MPYVGGLSFLIPISQISQKQTQMFDLPNQHNWFLRHVEGEKSFYSVLFLLFLFSFSTLITFDYTCH